MSSKDIFIKEKILREIFKLAPKRFKEKDLDKHYLAKKFNISGKELKNNIDFLVEIRLIQRFPGASYKKDKIFEWLIKEKGFHYLEEKEEKRHSNNLQMRIVYLTLVLAINSIAGTVFMLFQDSLIIRTFLSVIYIFALIVIAFLIFIKSK